MSETISDLVKKKEENVEICSVPQQKNLFDNEHEWYNENKIS